MIRRFRSVAGAAFVVLATVPASAQSPDAVDLLAATADRYRDATSFCADFEQQLSVPLLDQEVSGRGRLCQRQPDLFSMRFEDPAGDMVVVDGEHVWVYLPSSAAGHVLRTGVSGDRGTFDFHHEFLSDPASRYRVRDEGAESVMGVETRKLRLTPREPAGYRDAVLFIDPATRLVRRVVLAEENGSMRTITLSAIDFDAAVPPGTFEFEVPDGVRVISGS